MSRAGTGSFSVARFVALWLHPWGIQSQSADGFEHESTSLSTPRANLKTADPKGFVRSNPPPPPDSEHEIAGPTVDA